jgi:hypothetical protein
LLSSVDDVLVLAQLVGKGHGGNQQYLIDFPKGLHQGGIVNVVGLPDVYAPLDEVGGFADATHQGGNFSGHP